jgi:hypothetical protein
MFIDIQTDREICAVLFGGDRDTDLSGLGVQDVAVVVPHEALRLGGTQQEAERSSGEKKQASLYPHGIHPDIFKYLEHLRQVAELLTGIKSE